MVPIKQKAALRCVSAYCTVSTEAVCVLTGIRPIEIAADECRRLFSVTHQIIPGRGKVLRFRVTKGKSHTVNEKNGSLEAPKENGPVC